jgi:hypothetical protein
MVDRLSARHALLGVLHEQTGTIAGVAFSVQLPDHLTRTTAPADIEWLEAGTSRPKIGFPPLAIKLFSPPNFTPATHSDYCTLAPLMGKLNYTRREQRTDGLATTVESARRVYIRVEVTRCRDERIFFCRGDASNSETEAEATAPPLSKFDETKTWLERICDSFALH